MFERHASKIIAALAFITIVLGVWALLRLVLFVPRSALQDAPLPPGITQVSGELTKGGVKSKTNPTISGISAGVVESVDIQNRIITYSEGITYKSGRFFAVLTEEETPITRLSVADGSNLGDQTRSPVELSSTAISLQDIQTGDIISVRLSAPLQEGEIIENPVRIEINTI